MIPTILRALVAFSLAPMFLSEASAATLVIDGVVSTQAFDGAPQAGETFRFTLDIPPVSPVDNANSEVWGLYTSGGASIVFENGMAGDIDDVEIWIHDGTYTGNADTVVVRSNMTADAGSGLTRDKYWFEHLEFRFVFLPFTFADDAFDNYRFAVSGQDLQNSSILMIWDIVDSGGTGFYGEVLDVSLIPEPDPALLLLLSLFAVTRIRRRGESGSGVAFPSSQS